MMGRLKAERGTDEGVHWLRDAEVFGPLSPLAQVEHPKEAD